jgi:uncharacterized protein YfaS (alpha-2-macroglobulin family)
MNLRNVKSIFISIGILICLLFNTQSAFPQNTSFNFSISTNNLYFPGDPINLNVYSYNYSDKNTDKDKSVQFNIEILIIKDLNSFYTKQTSRYNLDVLSIDSLNLTYLTEEVYSFKKYFKQKNEYNYFQINESIPLNIKTRGAYLVKVTSGNKVAYCGFIVSSLGVISKAGNNSMLGFVVDRKTGVPVSNADLNFYLGQNKIGGGKTTDGVYYQIVNNVESNSVEGEEAPVPMIIGRYNEDIVVSDPFLYFGNNQNKFYTYIYTEQPVYRTNSEVNFKGTIRSNKFAKLEPFSNKEITVIINDSKGSEVSKQL